MAKIKQIYVMVCFLKKLVTALTDSICTFSFSSSGPPVKMNNIQPVGEKEYDNK